MSSRSTARFAVLAAALLLTACSGGPGTGSAPEVTAVPTPADARALRLPMQEYLPSAAQLEQLDSAQRILTDQCMARYGFRYRVPTLVPGGGTAGENARRYGLADPVEAAATGYGTEAAERTGKPAVPSMDPTERLVLGGAGNSDPKTLPSSQAEAERSSRSEGEVNGRPIPAGGCVREAYLKLWVPEADSPDPLRVQDLDGEGYDRSRQDSRVVQATDGWSACLAKRGYQARNPVSPQSELGLQPATFATGPGIAAATADVACKSEVNLVGVWFSVESAYQQRLIEQHGELLRAARRQLDDSLRLAAQLVTQAG